MIETYFDNSCFSVYDPDPISSLRKRRVSTDSHDSGASHPGDLRAVMESVRKPIASSSSVPLPPASKLTESSFPTEKKRSKSGASSGGGEKVKTKKHKKHKHSHKHKSHKRHKSGESKEARSAKYAVRSPVRAVEELSRGFTEDKEEAVDSSESDLEEHRDSGSEDEVRRGDTDILIIKLCSVYIILS